MAVYFHQGAKQYFPIGHFPLEVQEITALHLFNAYSPAFMDHNLLPPFSSKLLHLCHNCNTMQRIKLPCQLCASFPRAGHLEVAASFILSARRSTVGLVASETVRRWFSKGVHNENQELERAYGYQQPISQGALRINKATSPYQKSYLNELPFFPVVLHWKGRDGY